ncbi:MAG: hypothetical protein M2R45_05079 [Verrucomicrobia subdivision 3 bacterium]|nr:hypothetical protein [Limisphaerales bacterium]MCS1417156.1 hypothetical protein [Limisphaerales bacterium]
MLGVKRALVPRCTVQKEEGDVAHAAEQSMGYVGSMRLIPGASRGR